ncbi:MAG: DUF5009 domain-containing protein [Thermoguttaceae bacterium]|jgi:predicted acyltransferase|nr:DUF5009 domain-containing protein [Thermoguttaceae bacterium]
MSAPSPATPGTGRIASIDALRGFDMFWIAGGRGALLAVIGIFVSPLPDWLKGQIEHARWEGFTAWDLIMPLFLFVVGLAMPLAFARRMEQGQTKRSLYFRVLRRVVVLWILGMMVQGHLLEFDRQTIHFYSNTLQAIAAGYLVASVLLFHLPVWGQLAGAAVLLIGYWLLMLLVPFGGHPAGTLEEKLNLALYIDEQALGIFRDGTTYTWILSSMAFAGMVLSGVFAGHLLRSRWSGGMKVLWLALGGAGCLAGGWLWSGGFDQWFQVTLVGSWRFPIIKHLFTSSMVLWAAGWSYLLMALFYLVIDVLGQRWVGWFFEILGANAITAYVAWNLISFPNIAERFVGGLARYLGTCGPALADVGKALTPVAAFLILWLVLLYMYRKGTFVRV